MVEYPFISKFFVTEEGHKLHYIDEGQGPILLCVHGNPTWSYYYRNVVKELSSQYRVIALDNIGCGFSSKPQDYAYTLENHIQNITQFCSFLKIDQCSLLVHDWGGSIGLGFATRFPEKIEKIVCLNTAAFTDLRIPFRIAILRIPRIGEWLIRRFNLFAWPATFMTTVQHLKKSIRNSYLFPYNSFNNRIATAKFVQDIPMHSTHPTYKTLKTIEDALSKLNKPVLLLWGAKDWCFTRHFYNRFFDYFPLARGVVYYQAGHYVLEDAKDEIIAELKAFL